MDAAKKLEKRVKELKAKVPRPLSLMATSQQLKKARQSVLKGSPVGPKSFFKKISEMVEMRKAR